MAPAGCWSWHAIHELILQNMIISYNNLYQIMLAIPHHMLLQKQVRRPLLCCCMFYVALGATKKNRSTYEKATTVI